MKKFLLIFAVMFFAASAQATGPVHPTNVACQKSESYYVPTVGMTEAMKAKKFAGWKEAVLDRDQCLQTIARENGADRKGYVRMEKGTKVLVSGKDVVIAECGNAIFTKVTFAEAAVSVVAVESPAAVAYAPDMSQIQTIGGTRCNLYSDGTARLKGSTKVFAKGEKLTESVMERDLPKGQTCQQWRESFFKNKIDNPTKVVQM